MENIEVAGKRINAIIQTCNNTNMFILQSCQARTQEFLSGGGGPTFRKFLTSKKKRKKKKKNLKRTENRGFGCSFHSAEVWFKTSFNTS